MSSCRFNRQYRKSQYTASLNGRKEDRVQWARIEGANMQHPAPQAHQLSSSAMPASAPLELTDPLSTVPTIVESLDAGEKYPTLRKHLQATLPRIPSPAVFVAQSIALTAPPSAAEPQRANVRPAVHMLLEALERTCAGLHPRTIFCSTASRSRIEDVHARRHVAELFVQAINNEVYLDVRIVVRLAQCFGLDLDDLELGDASGAKTMLHKYVEDLLEGVQLAPAVQLILHFELHDLACIPTLSLLVDNNQDGLAEELASYLESEMQEALVKHLMAREMYKPAHRVCKAFKLQEKFPEVRRMHYQEALRKLVSRSQWDVAIAMAEQDAHLQKYLVQVLVEVEELARAVELHQHFGLETPCPGDDEVQANSLRARARYLQLDMYMPSERIQVVATSEQIAAAGEVLQAADVVGLDAEWRPSFQRRASRRPVAILQLATAEHCFLLDMIALCEECPQAAEAALLPVMSSSSTLKLGYAVSGDLSCLAATGLQCFMRVEGVVDLQQLARTVLDSNAPQPQGLSGLAELCLGMPLDKNVRMSNWEQRPLQAAQIRYAALDAVCLLPIYDDLLARSPPRGAKYVPYTYTGNSHAREVKQAGARAAREASAPAGLRAGQSAPSSSGSAAASGAASTLPVQAAFTQGPPVDTGEIAHSNEMARHRGGSGLTPLDPLHVQAALQELARRMPEELPEGTARMLQLPATAGRSNEAAELLGIATDRVVKSIAVLVAGAVSTMSNGATPSRVEGAGVGAVGTAAGEAGTGKGAAPLPVLLLLLGSQKAHLSKVAAHYGVRRKAVQMATVAECVDIFGYPPGSMPPLGIRMMHDTIIDMEPANRDEELYCGGGSPEHMLVIPARALVAAANAAVAPIAVVPEVPEAAVDARRGAEAAVQPVDDAAGIVASEERRGDPAAGAADGMRAGTTAFVIDPALARLGRWLRCLGVDVAVPTTHASAPRAVADKELIELAAAEGRVILTRHRRLVESRLGRVSCFYLNDPSPQSQLRQVAAHFKISFDHDKLLSRCSRCNGAVVVRRTAQQMAEDCSVPPHVLETVDEFWRCESCNKVFWMGPKSASAVSYMSQMEDMLCSKQVDALLDEGSSGEHDICGDCE
ncbi:hypothetical protein CYMTET_5483 [Cymbomonas tetramitiformis]|uniref:3'-5' exonuclease domain-containing protein n=1 Tax=Cymbomonas tetramitiformis TaxID=36881 RepID=A0AAE0GZH4_9CHLO|nr:hypothetical protein CYMTET_5483 [Cymbomonas tetramitiformis]